MPKPLYQQSKVCLCICAFKARKRLISLVVRWYMLTLVCFQTYFIVLFGSFKSRILNMLGIGILVLSWWFLPSILMDVSFKGKNEFKNKITMIKISLLVTYSIAFTFTFPTPLSTVITSLA